jgi:hypothetical protein
VNALITLWLFIIKNLCRTFGAIRTTRLSCGFKCQLFLGSFESFTCVPSPTQVKSITKSVLLRKVMRRTSISSSSGCFYNSHFSLVPSKMFRDATYMFRFPSTFFSVVSAGWPLAVIWILLIALNEKVKLYAVSCEDLTYVVRCSCLSRVGFIVFKLVSSHSDI